MFGGDSSALHRRLAAGLPVPTDCWGFVCMAAWAVAMRGHDPAAAARVYADHIGMRGLSRDQLRYIGWGGHLEVTDQLPLANKWQWVFLRDGRWVGLTEEGVLSASLDEWCALVAAGFAEEAVACLLAPHTSAPDVAAVAAALELIEFTPVTPERLN